MFILFASPLSFFLFIVFIGWWLAYRNPAALSAIFNIAIVLLMFAVVIAAGMNTQH